MNRKILGIPAHLVVLWALIIFSAVFLLGILGPHQVNLPCKPQDYSIEKCPESYFPYYLWTWPIAFFDAHNGSFQALAAFASAGFAGILYFITRHQTAISEQQTSLSEAQARAFVFLNGFNVELTTLAETRWADEWKAPDGADPALHVTRFSVQPIWKNSGTTPTKDMYVQVNWRPPGESLPPDFRYEYQEGFSLFLPPKSENSGEFIEMAATPNAIINYGRPRILENMQIGDDPEMFIWGRAEYSDVFNKFHFVEWCYRIRFSRHAGEKLKTSFIQWGPYNRSD